MATNGTKIAITSQEKIEFNPLFIKYVKKECTDEDILSEFQGDKKKFSRFQLYANGLINLLKTQEVERQIADIQKSNVLLTKGIKRHMKIIHQSRKTVETSFRQAVRI